MEYGTNIYVDDQYMKHVGYAQDICTSGCNNLPAQNSSSHLVLGTTSCAIDRPIHSGMQIYYSQNNIDKISRKITELLQGVDKQNRRIVVPNTTITNVMSNVYDNFKPATGDIYARYNIPGSGNSNYLQSMIDQVINIITTDVKVNLGMDECNSKLSAWTTILGDFNEHGLRRHAPIKIREKRPMPMAFNMNY